MEIGSRYLQGIEKEDLGVEVAVRGIKTKYGQVARKIDTRTCAAWIVKFKKTSHIILTAPSASIEDVVEMVKVFYPKKKKFVVTHPDAGDFVMTKIKSAYYPDGRGVNQDLEVVL